MAGLGIAVNLNICGGPVNAITQTWGTIAGIPIAMVGDPIAPHGTNPITEAAHYVAHVTQGSAWMTIAGVPVALDTGLASCGHTMISGQQWFALPSLLTGNN